MPIWFLVRDVVHALYDQPTASLADQQAISTDTLVSILHDCVQDVEQAKITDPEYLRLMGFPKRHCEAHEMWQHLIATMIPNQMTQPWQEALTTILEQGPLARRILQAVDQDFSRSQLPAVYRELCDCLDEGRLFLGVN